MKKVFGLVASLTVISAVCAGVLAFVNEVTEGPIRETARRNEDSAVRAVMPVGVVGVSSVGEDVFAGTNAVGAVVGFAAKGADGGGYGGEIVLMAGFEADGKTLVCYRTLAAAETPGLGMKLNTPEFSGQFAGRDGSSLAVAKDGGDIEAITSATITSRAVCRALGEAQKKVASRRSSTK